MTRAERAPRRAAGHTVVLKTGREKPMRQRHPWIFSGAIDSIGRDVENGAVADVTTATGEFVARGTVSLRSQITVRILTFAKDEAIDAAFWERRLSRAFGARPREAAARCVNAESDGLPGLVVDRYAGFLVVQASTAGVERHKADIVAALERVAAPRGIFERSDVDGRDKEGLAPATGLLAGEEPPELVEIDEPSHGGPVTLLVDVRNGQKTGTYLDQAENRRLVTANAKDADVLNVFSYAGGFALHAARAGARRIVNVDSSSRALELSAQTAAHNGFANRFEHVRADAFEELRRLREARDTFDLVIVDPPKLSRSAGHVERAARAYKDLARVAMHVIRPGGLFATFSCSGSISSDLFQKIVWSASLEAGRETQIVTRLGQASDHPILLTFPEGEYLKGLLCRVW
ncbi:MAG TPA: class I SAM-dependent rRNA methyltransferase [Polyangiaceae bacterium]|jgi:23S rRNA (cytosine1962-C5)-methyltransferase|nr:class I SAM-dependent rRNA methyltransferase [Polyangiaceae bacterium]